MRFMNLASPTPERPQIVPSTHAAHAPRRFRQSLAILPLLALSLAVLHPAASLASARKSPQAKTHTTTKLTASPNPVKSGQTLTLTADILPSKATGTVTAYVALKPTGPFRKLGTEPVVNGVAKGSEKIPSGINENVSVYIKAIYSGSATYATSTSNVVKVLIEK